ncbi:tripartite tricarboxylate transporter substrate binding protein [Treponema primitia]|uniref:Bug family tripartite tricarboxylate transporter substrate binding protein n=1 Tax=Treponema primitia TaxID=88058 RepID=UPI00397F6901
MKKFLSVFCKTVLSLVILSFIACGGSKKTAADTSSGGVISLKGKTITINIPHKAGSTTDIVARTFQPYFAKELGATVIIENLEGGGGNKSHNATYKAAPDGLTLEISLFPSIALGELTKGGEFKSLEYSYINTIAGGDYNNIFVPYDSPYKTLEDLIAAAKTKDIICAGPGIGTNSHMNLILFEKAAGIKFEYVTFDGGSEVAVAVAGRHTDCGMGNVVVCKQLAEDKKIRVLSVFGSERQPEFPDAPTAKELGYDNSVMNVCMGLIAPPKMDPALVQFIADASKVVCTNPEFVAQAKSIGSTVSYLGPAEFKALGETIYGQALIVVDDIKALAAK